VADFRAARVEPGKIKRGVAARVLELEPTEDILAGIARRHRLGQIVVGFAAETEQLVENARAKIKAKNLDFAVANDITQEGAGFDVDTNIVTLVFPDGRTVPLERMSKLDVAGRVLDEVVALRKGQAVARPA
jgi:phosphopantothenoylcysteine decarboxylase/phosphopantothenate--cysteine ligase